MFSCIFSAIIFLSALSLIPCPAAADAFLTGSTEAVKICIELAGAICFWSAVMELMDVCGLSAALSRFLRPLLCRLFPESCRQGHILSAISENVSANLLGLGNAATPAGIRAAKGMASLCDNSCAGDELCLFVVLNTASIQLIPSTIAALRASLGASAAFDIMPAVWISSLASLLVGFAMASFLRRLWS